MLEIVRRPDGIDGIGRNRTDVGDRADDIGLHGRIDIEPYLAPFGSLEMPMQLLPQRIAAADI